MKVTVLTTAGLPYLFVEPNQDTPQRVLWTVVNALERNPHLGIKPFVCSGQLCWLEVPVGKFQQVWNILREVHWTEWNCKVNGRLIENPFDVIAPVVAK